MSNIIKFNAPELRYVEESKAKQIKDTFQPMVELLEGFESEYSKLIAESQKGVTEEITAKAKRLRLAIGKVRIATGKAKDKMKEYIKLEDKAIMGAHNILVWAVKEREDNLQEIEKYFETQEAKRIEALQHERVKLLSPYVQDAHLYELGPMLDEVWKMYLKGKKQEHEDRIQAERAAEAARIEREKQEAAERERIQKENEELKKEAEIKAKADAIERKRREEKEAAERAKVEAERKRQEAILQTEREKAAKLQAEIDARKAAEAKAEAERLAKIQAELAKGDAAKVQDLIDDLRKIKLKYEFDSEAKKKMFQDVCNLLDKVIAFVK